MKKTQTDEPLVMSVRIEPQTSCTLSARLEPVCITLSDPRNAEGIVVPIRLIMLPRYRNWRLAPEQG